MHKGVINVRWFTRELNSRWDTGWRLDQLIELHGDTLMIWERRPDAIVTSAVDATPALEPVGAPTPAAPMPGFEGLRPTGHPGAPQR